jgi:hypothetical protein
MAFEQGNKLSSGRPKGAANKTTSELRQMMSDFVVDGWETMRTNYHTLSPSEQIAVITKIIPFVMPKLAPVDAPPEHDPTITRQDVIKEFLSRFSSEELIALIDELRPNE